MITIVKLAIQAIAFFVAMVVAMAVMVFMVGLLDTLPPPFWWRY